MELVVPHVDCDHYSAHEMWKDNLATFLPSTTPSTTTAAPPQSRCLSLYSFLDRKFYWLIAQQQVVAEFYGSIFTICIIKQLIFFVYLCLVNCQSCYRLLHIACTPDSDCCTHRCLNKHFAITYAALDGGRTKNKYCDSLVKVWKKEAGNFPTAV